MAREMNVKTFGIPGLVNQLKSGQINREAEMQRSYVWGNKEQTEFIDSVFQSSNTYIPPLIGAESEDEIEVKGKIEKIINLLDGVQRSTTLDKFLNNEIKLGQNILPVKVDEESEEIYNIAGKKFEELPEVVKTFFKLQKIQMIFFKNMSYADQERQFIKLQGGKKLSNAEVNKVRIGHNIREFIYKQLATELWTKYTNISSNREVKFETMQQVLMVMTGAYDLSGKSLQKFSEESTITDATMQNIEQITEYLNEVVKLIKKDTLPVELQSLEESEAMEKLDAKALKKYLKPIDYFKKVNVPIIYNTALTALQNDVSAEQFAQFIANFFSDISASYKRYTESGCSDSDKVCGRVDEMKENLVKEFGIEEKQEEFEEDKSEDQEQPEDQNIESDITDDHKDLGDEYKEEAEAILKLVTNVAS